MIYHLPGFALDTGDQVRGFGGSAGNVLIDGERPATKTDPLDEILKRIPAREVARIDLIRGGAPGIDMQGKSVIANVIRKEDNGLKVTTAVAGNYVLDGHFEPAMRLEGTKRSGATQFEGSMLISRGADDGTGNGHRVVTDGSGHVIQTAFERSFGEAWQNKGQAAVETPVLGGKLRVEGSIFLNPYHFRDNDTLIAPPGREVELYHQAPDTGEIGARYNHPLGAKATSRSTCCSSTAGRHTRTTSPPPRTASSTPRSGAAARASPGRSSSWRRPRTCRWRAGWRATSTG